MKHIITLCSLCTAISLVSTPVIAQGLCNKRVDVVSHLAKKYNEVPVAFGVTNEGGLVEILTTSNGDTWTIILSNPNGTSCLVAAGEGWRFLQPDYTKFKPQT